MPGLKSPMLMRSQTARSSKTSQGQIWDTHCQPLQPLDPLLDPAALSRTASPTFRSDQILMVRARNLPGQDSSSHRHASISEL